MTAAAPVRRRVVAFCPACHRTEPDRPLHEVRRLPARLEDRVAGNGAQVWLTRTCPEHGPIATLYEEDARILDYLERWTTQPNRATPDVTHCDEATGQTLRTCFLPSGISKGPGRGFSAFLFLPK